MRLRNLNLAPRAALFFTLIIALVFVLGGVAVTQMGELRDAENDVETNWMASVRQGGLINAGLLRMRLESLRASSSTDAQVRDKTLADMAGFREKLLDAVKQYEPLVSDDRERAIYLSVKDGLEKYTRQLDLLEPLIRTGDSTQSLAFINANIKPLTNDLEGVIGKLIAYNNDGATAAGKEAAKLYSDGLTFVIGLIAAVVVLTIALAVLLTRSITSPITDALLVAERIAGSDLSREVLVSGTDEAGRLLKALAQMQENLRNTILQISESSTQLASAAEEMTAVTEESSRGMVSQNDEVNQAATAVTQMSAAVDEVARNAESASDESQRTQGFTQTGLSHVAQTLKSIQSLSGNVANTGDQIQALSTRAQSINKVVEVIRAIAEQTNLLALNAAIEAARAGEQGRGFAVVADEVRALAHRTQQSTQEIEQMISGIQADSELAVNAMNMSKTLATQSLDVAQEASTSLDQIAAAIVRINERNLLIATASEEQAHVAREVDRNLVSIRELTVQSSAGASQTATACGEMSKLAVNLNRLVNRFVV
ncbi:MAG: methyl-accepting chemotaxis protein [Janthinobacterium lividum]